MTTLAHYKSDHRRLLAPPRHHGPPTLKQRSPSPRGLSPMVSLGGHEGEEGWRRGGREWYLNNIIVTKIRTTVFFKKKVSSSENNNNKKFKSRRWRGEAPSRGGHPSVCVVRASNGIHKQNKTLDKLKEAPPPSHSLLLSLSPAASPHGGRPLQSPPASAIDGHRRRPGVGAARRQERRRAPRQRALQVGRAAPPAIPGPRALRRRRRPRRRHRRYVRLPSVYAPDPV